MTPTKWRAPRTGDKQLRVTWRTGERSKHTYTAKQLVWDDRNFEFDIIAYESAENVV